MKYLLLVVCTTICLIANIKADDAIVGQLHGSVLDANLKKPIVGATVAIVSSNTPLGAITDRKGQFKISSIPVGRHTLKVSYIGYETKTIPNITIISGKETYLEILLTEQILKTGEVTVIAEKDFSSASNDITISSVRNLRPEVINRFAGMRQDPSRMASTTAGVAGDNNQRNDIIVRGNSPLGVLWRVEGADVPNPNHFTVAGTGGGVFSIINNNLLSNCDFITSAFPAEYIGKNSAVFDVALRKGNNRQAEHTFQLGLNGLEFGTEGPIVEGNSSYLANIRFVSLAPLEILGVDLSANVVPEYYDGTFKVDFADSPLGKISLWGIGGKNQANILDSEDDINWSEIEKVEDEHIRSSMFATGVSSTHFFSEFSFGRLIISASGADIHTFNEYVYANKTKLQTEDFKSSEYSFLVNYSFNTKISRKLFFKSGLIVKRCFYETNFYELDDKDNSFDQRIAGNGTTSDLSAFANLQYKPSDKFETNLGLAFHRFELTKSQQVEPRVSMQYKINELNSINFAFGLHSQSHPLLYYFYRYPNPNGTWSQTNKNIDMMKSLHYILGYDLSPAENWSVKTNVYYQDQFDIPVSTIQNRQYYSFVNLGAEFAFQGMDSLRNSGTAENYGIELSIEKYISDGYYFLFTGSAFRSLFVGGDDKLRNSAFDLGHCVNLLAGYEYKLNRKSTLSADFKMSHIGGRRFVPIDEEQSILQDRTVFDFENAYKPRLKSYFSADIKLSLNINLQSTTHSIFIAIDNLTNYQNEVKREWNTRTKSIETEYQIGLFPYLGYRINF